jgi:hypothetical protein
MELVIFIVALMVLGIAAQLWGVDSRDASTDPRGPVRPVGLS